MEFSFSWWAMLLPAALAALMFNWFWQAKKPERIPTDTVIPFHAKDNLELLSKVTLHLSMRFDDVLDVDKMSDALWKLLQMPGWKKFGARMRRSANGGFEYHVPAEYTAERPPFILTRAVYDMNIADHPIGRKLSRPEDGRVTLSPDVNEHRLFVLPPDYACHVNRWLSEDLPQLQLHVVSCKDATVVTFTWNHTLFDAPGRRALLQAWTAVLEGRDHDVQNFHGYDSDPMAEFGELSGYESAGVPPKIEHSVLEGKEVKGLSMLRFIWNLLEEVLFHRQEAIHHMFIPASYFAKLRASALADLQNADPSTIVLDNRSGKPFLSDGDILAAWWNRMVHLCQPWSKTASPSRQIAVFNLFSLRDMVSRTAPVLIPKGSAYVHNCANLIISFFSLKELATLPLGVLAARIRKDLSIQGTRPQLDANERHEREFKRKNGRPILYGNGTGDMVISAFSNWTKAHMFETDFSTAVIDEARSKESVRPKGYRRGKPSYIQSAQTSSGFVPARNSSSCIGMDGDGNYWVVSTLRKQTWENMRKAINNLS